MTPGLDDRAVFLRRGDTVSEEALQRRLAAFNRRRWQAALPHPRWTAELEQDLRLRLQEGRWVEGERRRVHEAVLATTVPLADWFAPLRQRLPQDVDVLCTWLAADADMEPVRWLLRQEAAAEMDIDLALTAVALLLPTPARLRLLRDGAELVGDTAETAAERARLTRVLRLQPLSFKEIAWEALAPGNLMFALANERRYAWQALGALVARSFALPLRLAAMGAALRRLGVPAPAREGLERQASRARRHAASLLGDIVLPLVGEDAATAQAVVEGALLRQRTERRCAARYRHELEVPRLSLAPPGAGRSRDA